MAKILLSQIRESKVALRPVNRNTEEYLGLVESIKKLGVLNAITVRKLVDPDTKEEYYSLVDGLHRYTASVDAGKTDIEASILDLNESDTLVAQIAGNIHKIETRPAEYSKQLVRILGLNPMMTMTELASQVGKSVQWLSQRLSLIDLPEAVGKLVDEGKIVLTNAYALAKLKEPAEIENFLERAMTLEPEVFLGQVNTRAKELREARRQGREARAEEFVPQPHLQKVGDIKGELDSLSNLNQILKSKGFSDPTHLEVAKETIKWVLHLDDQSVEKARARFEADQKAKAENKAKRERERAEAKAAKAKEDAEKASQELQKLQPQTA